jgi:ABC-type transporter Mla MlaB component
MTIHDRPLPPCTPVWNLGGVLDRAEIPALCDRLAGRIGGTGARVIVCDVSGLGRPDAVAVEALARLQLTAMRLGRRIWLRGASAELLDLLAFVGLRRVLPPWPQPYVKLWHELRWKPEQRKQPLGVEEEVEAGDPAG